ncbi:MAG: hypothetical protein QGH94_06680, partial [Phycisphaerae bacterium]|nr:hypothetical protein [Phycisphaerae bacterium]
APTVTSEIADLTVNSGDPDTVMYLSGVFDDSVDVKPVLDYTVIEIDPLTGVQTAGSGVYVYTFTLYGNDGVESVFATTSLTFTGAIQQVKAFGAVDVDTEELAVVMEASAGSGYVAALDSWIFAGWGQIAPDDTSVSGSTLVMSVGSGTSAYYEQKDLVQIAASGDVQWNGLHSRVGEDYATSGLADANRLVYSITGNTNPSLVTGGLLGAQLTLAYAPGVSGLADITVRATDPEGAWVEDTFTITVESGGEVVGRHLFYNNSSWDTVSDDDAIAADKTALLPGQTASPANYSSYSRGINGVMVDVDGLAGTPTAGDFAIEVNQAGAPDTWSPGPAPTVTVRPGDGDGGSDRIVLTWADGAIVNQWVKVTVLSDANGGDLGLASDDEFYFGNAIGDSDGDGDVDDDDYNNLKSQFGLRGAIGTLSSDLDGDGRVSLGDFVIVRNSLGGEVQAPTVLAPAPAAAPGAPLAAPTSQEAVQTPLNTPAAAPGLVSVDEPILPAASAPTSTEPTVERELYDALQGGDSGEGGLEASLDADDLLADVLLEAVGSQLTI